MFTTESGEYALRVQKSKKYIDKEKEKEKETIVTDRRNIEKIKIKEERRREHQQMNQYQLRKEGEKITEKIFPDKDDNLILEKRKVEVFRDVKYNKEKSKYQISSQRRGQIIPKKKFKEEKGITKSFIKEKMIEIWLEESSESKENSFSLYAEEGQNRLSTYEIRSSRNISSEKNKEDINNLLKTIKEKDNELNLIANQLKSEMTKNQKGSYKSSNQVVSTSKNVYTSSTTNKLNMTNLTLEEKIQQLLNKLKEKDEQFNKLVNKIKTQSSQNEYEQKAISRFSGKQRDKSSESYTNKHYIKNVYESINKTTEEYDTLNTQNTINVENIEKITQLENVIKEKDVELEKLITELDTLKERPIKKEFNDLIFEQCYGLGIYSENETYCPSKSNK